jgi:Flp pilus assembly protein CpaB
LESSGIGRGRRILSTRSGTLVVGVLAAAIAALLLLVYLNRYRHNLSQRTAPVAVLVAKSLIQKGTPGSLIGTKVLYQATSVPRDQLKAGALSDPSSLSGQVALADIYPGQQLTVSLFGALAPGDVGTELVAFERAVSIPVDATHGLIGTVRPGDHVDILIGFSPGSVRGAPAGSIIKTLLQNIVILQTTGSSLTLRVSDQQAARLAWASDNGKIWITLRPAAGARQSVPRIVSLSTVYLGGTR